MQLEVVTEVLEADGAVEALVQEVVAEAEVGQQPLVPPCVLRAVH